MLSAEFKIRISCGEGVSVLAWALDKKCAKHFKIERVVSSASDGIFDEMIRFIASVPLV
jgi:hypothetical protein